MFLKFKHQYGYILNTNVYEVSVKPNETSYQKISNEVPTGTFTLIKRNDDGNKIAGTKYRIWNDNGYDKQFATDENGKIEVTGLKLGKYKYQEIQASNGYLLDSKIYEFELTYKDQNTEIVNANAERVNKQPTGNFKLIKKNVNGDKIAGTKYRIWNDNGYDKQFVTDKNGKIEVTGLKLGKYKYQEIQASNGYLLDSKIYEFELTYKDQNTEIVNVNAERINEEPTGTFTLMKMSKKGTTKIVGTKYRIWNDNGYDKQFVTDKNGKIEVTGLKLGKYKYQEIQATEGYLLDSTIYEFELKYKDQNTRVIYANAVRYNEVPTGTFTLTKKNIDGEKIVGTKYRIWNDNGYDKQFTTDENGKIEVTNLELGKYNYQEIQASNGYIIDKKVYSFTLRYKDQNTKIILENAERTNEKTMGTFTLVKKSADGKQNLPNAKYRVWNDSGYNREFTTDENGKIEIKNLELGKYNYQETKAPYGYVIDKKVYTFELKYKDQNTSVVYANAERTNQKTMGTFTLVKKSADGKQNLTDAKYKVWNDNGYNKEFTTDENGKIEIKNLELGKYNYQETKAPYGYVIDKKVYTFELKYKDQNTSVVYANAERTNQKTMGTFTLIKQNTDKTQNLPDAKYRVWNDSGYNREFTTDKNGKIEITNLELGKYNYQEIQAPYGYVIDEKVYTFELTYKDQYTSMVYTNAKRANEKTTGTFTLIKKNADSSSNIEGTKYKLWNTDGYNKEFVTDKNGKIEVTNLELGKYKFQEIEATAGYLIDTKVYEFELTYKDQYTKVVYANDTKTNTEPVGKITIIKKDSETGNIAQGNATLEGAVYKVYANEDIYNVAKTKKYYSKGDLVATRTMNEKGETEDVTELPLGKYIVKEETASLGYILDTKEYEVNLEYKDQNTKLISEIVTSNEVVKKMQVHIFKSGIKEQSGLIPGLEGAEFSIKLYSDVEKAYEQGYTYAEIWNGIDEDGNKIKVDSNQVAKAQVIAPTYETIKTDKDGNAYTQKNLPYGKYIVKETKTPTDYETSVDFCFSIKQDESEIEEIAQKIKHLVVNNEQLETYVKIIKKDLQTEKNVTLSSATFEIRANKDIYDRATGKIIYKKGETIKQKIGGTNYSSFTTNADNIVIPNGSYSNENDEKGTTITPLLLPVGSYLINEIRVPNGFIKLEKPVIFNVGGIRDYDKDKDGDYISEIIIKNEQPQGTLKINKSIKLKEDIDTSLIKNIDFTKISFELVAKENIIDYADGSVIYEKDKVIGKYNLKENGTLTIENLPMGKYFLKENSTIDGAVLDQTEYEVKFEQTDTTTKIYNIDLNIENETTCVEISKQDITGDKELVGAKLSIIDEKGKIIDKWTSSENTHKIEGLKVNETYTLREEISPDGYVKATEIKFTIKNTTEIQKVKMIDKIVEISKIDIAGNEIEGAELKVEDKDGKIVDNWTSTKEPHKINGLKEGETYTLYEDYAPDGFVISNKIEFKVTEDKKTQKIEMKDKVVEISKLDIAGNEIEGAILVVTSLKTKNIVDKWISEKEPHKVSGLVEGETYILHEEIVANGYVKATDIEFKVTEDKKTQKITMIDKVVEITKTDLTTGEELEGAELEVTDEDGNIIDKWTSTKEPHKVKGLEEGKTYILKETTAPYGYEITEEIKFVVTTDKETQKVEMKDMPILKNIRVIKVDSETNEIIKDKFTFGIYEDSECTKLIKEIKANKEDGFVIFENLRYNTYFIKEIVSPKDYELSDKIVKIEISDKGIFADDVEIQEENSLYSFEFDNQKIETPKTRR